MAVGNFAHARLRTQSILHACAFPDNLITLVISHGTQTTNAMAHEMLDGTDKLTTVRRAYRAVLIPGIAALFTDCIGFSTLFVIRIGVIQDITAGASIGVVVDEVFNRMHSFMPKICGPGLQCRGPDQRIRRASGGIWSRICIADCQTP